MQATLGGSHVDMDTREEGLPGKPRFSAQVRATECGVGAGPGLLGTHMTWKNWGAGFCGVGCPGPCAAAPPTLDSMAGVPGWGWDGSPDSQLLAMWGLTPKGWELAETKTRRVLEPGPRAWGLG